MKQKKTDLKISKKKEMTIEKYISKKMKLMTLFQIPYLKFLLNSAMQIMSSL